MYWHFYLQANLSHPFLVSFLIQRKLCFIIVTISSNKHFTSNTKQIKSYCIIQVLKLIRRTTLREIITMYMNCSTCRFHILKSYRENIFSCVLFIEKLEYLQKFYFWLCFKVNLMIFLVLLKAFNTFWFYEGSFFTAF